MGLFDGLTGSVPVPTSRYEAVDVINLKILTSLLILLKESSLSLRILVWI